MNMCFDPALKITAGHQWDAATMNTEGRPTHGHVSFTGPPYTGFPVTIPGGGEGDG